MSDEGIIVKTGKTLRNRLLAGEPAGGLLWFAVGEGNWVNKDSPPAEDYNDTGLAAETARKRASRHSFLIRDDNGPIMFRGHLWSETETPTDVIAFFCDFLESEIVGQRICEEGLFGGDVVTVATPLALPGDVISPGVLFWKRNRPQAVKGPRDAISLVAVIG
jgi:hypothetical protein